MSQLRGQNVLDALEQRLLDAARSERPRPTAREQTILALAGGAMLGSATASSAAAAALGAAGGSSATGTGALASGAAVAAPVSTGAAAATAVGGAKVAVGAATFFGIAKAVAIGAISGAVVLGAAQKLQKPEHVSVEPISTVTEIQTPASSKAKGGVDSPLPRKETSAPEAEVPWPATSPQRLVPPRALPETPSREPTPIAKLDSAPSDNAREASSLALEVALLDRARDALVAGDPSRALSILDDYDRANIGPKLSAEAALLRIEACLQRGEPTRAAALARTFLREHPQSPVADRMRAIIHAASK